MSWVTGRCNVCGYIFDVTNSLDCPACRAARVAKAFRPVDSLRTALGVSGQRRKDAEEWSRMREEIQWGYYRPESFNEEPEETPSGLRIPQDEAEQIYQLRRLFRK